MNTLPQEMAEFEAYIKRWRDQYPKTSCQYDIIDLLLDDYRMHIATGTKLDQPVVFSYEEWGQTDAIYYQEVHLIQGW